MQAPTMLGIAAINHLLAAEPWATERLRQHAGRHVAIETPLLRMQIVIDEQGLFGRSESPNADVTLSIPAEALVHAVLDRDRMFSAIRLGGAADVAESLAFVFRNLRWDVEADLAKAVGDIPARRVALLGKAVGDALRRGTRNVAENVREYVVEESSLLARRDEVTAFSAAVAQLRDDVARLEKRLARL